MTFRVNGHVGEDGLLKLELPLELSNADVDVVVVIQPREKRGWPEGYFEQTAGSLSEIPIERPPQGDFEERDPLL